MSSIHQHFSVVYDYKIIFTKGLFNKDNSLLVDTITESSPSGANKVVVVIDKGVVIHHQHLLADIKRYFELHRSDLLLCGEIKVVQGGEIIKNSLDGVKEVLQLLNEQKIDRHSYILAIGGGAVLDMVGFAAAIGHRGIRLIRVPTTVLSQNDSGVGVKNSINFFGKKNFLGTFDPPYAVINDVTLLTSLDDRQWRAGISEAIKVALIKDAAFFDWIEEQIIPLRQRSLEAMEQLIFRCAEMHTEHIGTGGDPFERGSSRPLDFGHWSAHKLEQLTNYEITHGEAVAIGISLDVVYSHFLGLIKENTVKRILRCFQQLGFAIYHPLLSDPQNSDCVNPELIKGLEEFREHLGGQLTIMLLDKIGKGVEYNKMDKKLIGKSVVYLSSFSNLLKS